MAVAVLLVEDDPSYQRLIRANLQEQQHGATYQIKTAATLADGLALAAAQRFDVALLDLGLPDAEGIDVVEQLRATAPQLPIVVLSGRSDVDTALESMRRGVQEYLVKGQAEDVLLPRAIRYAIERKRSQDLEQLLVGIVSHDLRNPLSTMSEWEAFARSLLPEAGGMTVLALRDHADDILSAIVRDMRTGQSAGEQAEKSKGRGQAQELGEVGKLHAALRIEVGFKLGQMVAEYRALRASVLRMWEKQGGDSPGVTRFNEAIDEALTVAVNRFMETTEHYRDQSLGILGHDLRNPLSAIIMGSTMLVGSKNLDDRSVVVAARMLNSATRMNRMIGDLLDLTRTRFGDLIPVAPLPIDLDPLCRQVVAELEGLRPAGGLSFTGTGDLCGEWDGDRVSQVLSNLIRNAIQNGGDTDPISVVAEDKGSEVVVKVHNGGAAIPEGALSRIFEPMVRRANDHRTTGLGLGLYIANQIVQAHGGTLGVTSTSADGTTFTAHLPRAIPAPLRKRHSDRPPGGGSPR